MAEANNSEMKHFRASPGMSEALARAAEREGVSQSEIIRRALAGRLGCDESAAPLALDPFERLVAASRGELQAQRDLAREAVRLAFSDKRADTLRCLTEAMIFARMAATHGDVADQGLVISIAALLVEVAGEEACEDEIAEALARIALVDEARLGNRALAETVTDAMQQLFEGSTPRIVALAKLFHERIHDEVKGAEV